MQKNITQNQPSYEISSGLLNLLKDEHPDALPDYEPSAFELGKMVGAKEIIEKIELLTQSQEIQKLIEGVQDV